MIQLPVDVICGGILPYFSVCDLQALDTAFTNKCLRPHLRQVWKSYQYDSLYITLGDIQVIWLCRVGVQIISLVLCVSQQEWIIPNIPTLKKLRLASKIHSSSLLKIVSNSRKLEEVYVNEVYGSDTDNAVSALAQNCRQLHTLHIRSEDLTDAGIAAIAQHCIHLDALLMCESKVTNAGIQALCDNCPHMKHIELINCDNLKNASLIAIADTYPNLETLTLRHVFTDNGLIYFADKCHELRSVSVKCYNITSRGLTALWAANPNLMDVDIEFNHNITDDDIVQLVQCCPLLQKLNISYCYLTDVAVIAVAEHCPQLRSLDIRDCNDLSDASLIALEQHCHELISINISFLKNISDVGIAALAAGCPLLQEFYAFKANITDAGVVALARGCRDLRKVDIGCIKTIRFTPISAIAENCPLISTLNVSYCTEVDDACLYVIAQHCRNITVLNIENANVSTDALQAVIVSCRMLETVHCSGCFKSEEDVVSIRKCSARVRVLAWFV